MKENKQLPTRIRLKDFSGQLFTLNDHLSAWRNLTTKDSTQNRAVVLLGIASGNLLELPFVQKAIEQKNNIYWLEAPETIRQLHAQNIPLPPHTEKWIQIDRETFQNSTLDSQIFFYEPGRRLAPDFWGKLLAEFEVKHSQNIRLTQKSPSGLAWLPGNTGQLLHKELYEGLEKNGLSNIISELPESPVYPSLEKIWKGKIPDFALSVNFRGLDPEGKIFELCRALDIPLAIWLVDNPWHILSGIPLPWWREAKLFVSDPSFVTPLRNWGANSVTHCPLAVSSHMWRPPIKQNLTKLLFIGRSTFPKKKEFFAKIKADSEIEKEIQAYLAKYKQFPDYHWWQNRFGETPWPGKAVRKVGFYADYCSALNRATWLRKASDFNIRIIGDEAWKNMLPDCTVEKPIDYYGTLPDVYQQSEIVLNVTSLLLPGSLNQRHFDVWAAGSLLLTDRVSGLNIFSNELTNPISVSFPEELPDKLMFWENHSALRKDLIDAWQNLLKVSHSYAHRIDFIRKSVTNKEIN